MQRSRSNSATLEQLLGIDLPVVQAPMAGVQEAELAAAVSNAGGLGSLPCAMLNAEALEAEVHRLTTLTKRPFNLNFFCHQTPTVHPQQAQDWLQSLSAYFVELGVEPPASTGGNLREPF